jgi:GTPase
MVIVSPKLNPVACWEFEGDILVLHHPTTISARYQAMGNFHFFSFIIFYPLSSFYPASIRVLLLTAFGVGFVLISFLVHCGSVRQTASILEMSSDCLRTGDKASVHFRFIKHPEYLKPGQKLVSMARTCNPIVRNFPSHRLELGQLNAF